MRVQYQQALLTMKILRNTLHAELTSLEGLMGQNIEIRIGAIDGAAAAVMMAEMCTKGSIRAIDEGQQRIPFNGSRLEINVVRFVLAPDSSAALLVQILHQIRKPGFLVLTDTS